MSCTDNTTNGIKVWRFQLDNGNTGEMSVNDPLLDTEERAKERAMSEFLKNGYAQNVITFQTYRTDLKLNDTINIYGIMYLVKGKSLLINGVKIVVTIRAVRYD